MNPLSQLMIEFFSKFSNSFVNFIKFGASVGAVVLVYYLLNIQYLPSEFAIGDGLLLLMLSMVIGIMISLIFLLLWMQGKTVIDFIFFIYALCPHKIQKYIKGRKGIKNSIIIPKIEKFNNLFIYPISIFFMLLVYAKESSLGLFFYIIVSIYCYIFYIFIYNISLEYNYLSKILDGQIGGHLNYDLILENKRKEKKNILSVLLIAFVLLPFFMGSQFNVVERMIHYSMEKTNVRIMNSRIYVKKDFANLILKQDVKDKTYVEIMNIDILFRGGGKNTFIGFVQNGRYIKMEIPNDSLLSVYHANKK